MGQVARYDIAQVRKPERTSQGFLRADAVLTRSGVFTYRNGDGSTRKEYRPPDEVFHADALSSFEDAPLTSGHPSRLVDTETAKSLAVGWVKEAPRKDGSLAVSRIVVTDAKAIAEVEDGSRKSVSCGYTCDYDPTPGVTPDGERFDGVQRNIRGNHLALVPAGRAGPEATVRLDAEDAVMVADVPAPTQRELFEVKLMKIKLDGVDYEATEQLAQAIEVAAKKVTERADAADKKAVELRAELDKAKARADAAEEDAKKAKAERADAASPAKVQELVKARLELERVASSILGAETKLDELDDAAVKKAVVIAVYPNAKERLDGASEDYLRASFERAVEAFGERGHRNDGLAALRQVAAGAPAERHDAKEKFYADEADAWKPKA